MSPIHARPVTVVYYRIDYATAWGTCLVNQDSLSAPGNNEGTYFRSNGELSCDLEDLDRYFAIIPIHILWILHPLNYLHAMSITIHQIIKSPRSSNLISPPSIERHDRHWSSDRAHLQECQTFDKIWIFVIAYNKYNIYFSNFKTSLFQDRTWKEHLECSVCRDTFKKTSLTPCMHRFCMECITGCLDLYKECPLCKRNISKNDLLFDLDFDKLIGEWELWLRISYQHFWTCIFFRILIKRKNKSGAVSFAKW